MFARIILVFFLLISFAANAVTPEKPNITNPLIGTWTWTREENNCMEVYTFKTDGTIHVISGKEMSESIYTISLTPSVRAFYALKDKVVKDFGGKDCVNDESDSTGQEASNLVIFHPSLPP